LSALVIDNDERLLIDNLGEEEALVVFWLERRRRKREVLKIVMLKRKIYKLIQ